MKNKKHIIIEIILVLIIIIQGITIYYLYNMATKNFFKGAMRMIEEYSCLEKTKSFYEIYENGNYNEFIDSVESLYKDGYEDKLLLSYLAESYFMIGNELKAAEYLELSLKAAYKCKIVEPKYNDTKQMDEAIGRYHLSEIYTLLGENDKAKIEFDKAYGLAKQMAAKEKKSDIIALEYLKRFSLVEGRKKIINKKKSS